MSEPRGEVHERDKPWLMGRVVSFLRRLVALSLAIASTFFGLWMASCLAYLLFSWYTDNRDYFLYGFSWRQYLRFLFDPRNLAVCLGGPVATLVASMVTHWCTRPDRVAGQLQRGRTPWVAHRFATLGIWLSLLNLLLFMAVIAYRGYAWGL